MSTVLRVFIILAASWGAYVFFGNWFPSLNRFWFGVGGLGFTYLAVIAAATGGVAAKVTA